MIYPDEEKITCSYNLGDQLEKVHGYKSYGYDYVSKIGYDKFEQRTYLKYCNGAETFYTYAPQRGKAGGQMAHTNTYGTDTGKKFQLANVKDVIGDFASYGSDPRRTQYAGSETWNFTKGKRNAGGISGAEPIKK